ncbi:hypothetical protein [Pseudaestuariivita sp.]|uniref:hypothetical protein n=1 Tax=Pseudaestuariivita sp. TaxID=2211669 RepID=UPI004059DD68
MSALAPGDFLAVETPAGTRHVQVTHLAAPYPPVLRALKGDIAEAETAFVAMADLRTDDARITRIARADVPIADRAFPTFRLAVRDLSGQPLYWWYWSGDGLRLAPDPVDMRLPLRQITPLEDVIAALAQV